MHLFGMVVFVVAFLFLRFLDKLQGKTGSYLRIISYLIVLISCVFVVVYMVKNTYLEGFSSVNELLTLIFVMIIMVFLVIYCGEKIYRSFTEI